MRLDQIWTYPVKSMLGHRMPTAQLADNGIVGDRMWALRDEQRDAIASARRIGGLSRLGTVVGPDGVTTIVLPDGSRVAVDDPHVNEQVSAAVAHPVSMYPKQPADNVDFYRRGAPDDPDIMADLRTLFGRLESEPLPDFSVFPPEMVEFEYPPGNYFDCYPLMLMTTAALRSIQQALPDSAIDERRFRPSLVIDTGDDDGDEVAGTDERGHPEFSWTGRTLRIGAAELLIGSPCPRCTVVTREFADDLPEDRSVLRHIVRDLDQNVGVYATVVVGGPISVGDAVELV